MTRMTQLLLSLVVSIVVAGCGRDQPKTEQVGTGTPTTRDTVATRGTRDSGFLGEQLAVGDKQVGLARLASERATRPAVRTFGETMLRDHQQANEELRQIASRQQVKATGGPEGEQLKIERERLSRLSGEQFDREYLDEIIADLQVAVGDLENGAKGDDLEIRQWAAKNLPLVRRHLEEAQQLRQTSQQKGNPPQ